MQINGVSVGGSIDTSVIVETFVNNWRAQHITPLEDKQTTYQTQGGALASISSYFSTLSSKLSSLAGGSAFLTKKATSSDQTVLTVAAESAALNGIYNINVAQLAQQHKVGSAQLTSAGTDISDAGAGTKQFRISINGVDTDISVDVAAGDTNAVVLTNIASAIGASGADVNAIVVNETSSTSRLLISSKSTGLTNVMTMQDLSGTLLQDSQVIDGAGAFLNQIQAAQDALLTIDGINFQRSTNTLSDVIGAVTLQLKKTGSSTVDVGADTAKITEKLNDFITAYNNTVDYVKTQTSYDMNTKQKGALFYNSTARNIANQMMPLVAYPISSLPGEFNSLASIGIDVDRTGKLSIVDPGKLEEALSGHLTEVKDIFSTPTDGVAVKLKGYLDYMTTPGSGALAVSQDGITTALQRISYSISLKEDQLLSYQRALIQKFAALDALLAVQQSLLDAFTGASLLPE